jgi:hypothetical protein
MPTEMFRQLWDFYEKKVGRSSAINNRADGAPICLCVAIDVERGDIRVRRGAAEVGHL